MVGSRRGRRASALCLSLLVATSACQLIGGIGTIVSTPDADAFDVSVALHHDAGRPHPPQDAGRIVVPREAGGMPDGSALSDARDAPVDSGPIIDTDSEAGQTCLAAGQLCTVAGQCCAGVCSNFECAASTCKANGQTCTTATECCSGGCPASVCVGECLATGAPCGKDDVCCSGTCRATLTCK